MPSPSRLAAVVFAALVIATWGLPGCEPAERTEGHALGSEGPGPAVLYRFLGTVERTCWADAYDGKAVTIWRHDGGAVTVLRDVEPLEGDPPVRGDGRIALLIRSPARTFHMSMAEAADTRFRMTVYRRQTPEGPRLSLRVEPVEP